jgi:hypothetical protein
MKLFARAVTALALLGLATPALPCGDMGQKEKTATSSAKKSSTVAKSGTTEKKGATPSKGAGEAKPASATN